MAHSAEPSERIWKKFYGPNMGYVEEQFELYKEDPSTVDPSLKEMFDKHGAPKWLDQTSGQGEQASGDFSTNDVRKITSAMKYIDAIRRFGHLEAKIYAVGGWDETTNLLNPETYEITDADLQGIPAGWVWDKAPSNVETAYDVVEFLREKYTGKISFE